MKNPFRLVGGIFLLIGLIFLPIAGFLFLQDARFAGNAATGDGQVLRFDSVTTRDSDGYRTTSHRAVISFTDHNGRRQEFREQVNTSPPRFSVGDKVTVLYDPANPAAARVDDFWARKFLPTMFLALGGIMAVVGAIFLTGDMKRGRKVARLKQMGQPIEADFLEVFQDRFISINHKNPFRVAVQAPDPVTDALRRFESAPIWVDPTRQLTGRKVSVLIDPARPKDYHVDLSSVVDEAG